MRRMKIGIGFIVMILLCLMAVAAMADTFDFADRKVTLFEDEKLTLQLVREGLPAEGGELSFRVGNEKVAEISENGTLTALKKGQTQVTAVLKKDRKTWKASVNVTVARRVTDVTLSTKGLTVYDSEDPAVAGLLKQDPAWPVIVLPAGKSVNLNTTCTPESASDRKVIYTSTDEGILKAGERSMKAVQAGECDLIIASRQNPEITETYHILVTQPVSGMEISAERNKMAVGTLLQLEVTYSPGNATIQKAEWSSKNTRIATVDENGLVTGLKKGTAVIEARAADGSGKGARFNVTVTQPAETLTMKDAEIQVITGRRATLTAQVGPGNTDDKTLTWVSSDESIATVSKGVVTGVKAGTCEITCISNSNPNLMATASVQVVQRVSKIEFVSESGLTFPVKTEETLSWTVYPEDATNQTLKFTSSNPKVASVDQNGKVTGISRGSTTITAAATDGSGKRASVRVNITQPVEGVTIQYGRYHVQLNGVLGVKALISPSNANNYAMQWFIEDENVASVKGNKNVGNVRGLSEGVTKVTGVTEDGGYSATAEIRVADFNGAVTVEEVRVRDNQIRLTFRNVSDFSVEKVYFRVECYDEAGTPMICSLDGENTFFEGSYPLLLEPREKTDPDEFDMRNMGYEQPLGTVVVRITGWLDSEGYTRNIRNEDDQPMGYWTGNLPFNLPSADK